MIPKATFRGPIPKNLPPKDLLRRHLHLAGIKLVDLAPVLGVQPLAVHRMFQRKHRPILPRQLEALIAHLTLDEFDANELRLAAAREAGYPINPQFLLEAQ